MFRAIQLFFFLSDAQTQLLSTRGGEGKKGRASIYIHQILYRADHYPQPGTSFLPFVLPFVWPQNIIRRYFIFERFPRVTKSITGIKSSRYFDSFVSKIFEPVIKDLTPFSKITDFVLHEFTYPRSMLFETFIIVPIHNERALSSNREIHDRYFHCITIMIYTSFRSLKEILILKMDKRLHDRNVGERKEDRHQREISSPSFHRYTSIPFSGNTR